MTSLLKAHCLACESTDLTPIFQVPQLPILSNVLWPQRAAARAARRGEVDLTFCEACGAIFNRAFDPTALDYDARYENALHFSPFFQRYAAELADQLVQKYDLRRKRLVEIGCGDGAFLTLLCQQGENRGQGFDPSFAASHAPPLDSRIEIVAELFSPESTTGDVDFLCCRHVLEHLADPLDFLRMIRAALGDRDVPVYFEVPNAHFMLQTHALWDILYEHVSYFAPPSLARLFHAAGFEVTAVRSSFGGQFLGLEARPRRTQHSSSIAKRLDDELPALVADFAARASEKISGWRWRLAEFAQDSPERLVVWGAGSKGVTFLNLLQPEAQCVRYVVDVNPRKHGKFIAGAGAEIVSPQCLQEIRPQWVVVMNPNYQPEVEAQLAELGLPTGTLAA